MSEPDRTPAPRRVVVAGGAAAAMAAIIAVSGPMIGGFEGQSLAVYRDPVGILTACHGHTGPELRPGQTFTPTACGQIFDADQRKVIAAIGRCTKVAVPVSSFAAFTSFSFNVGAGVYCKKFAPLVNRGQLKQACAKLSLYANAGGHPLAGLVTRRARERALCERGL